VIVHEVPNIRIEWLASERVLKKTCTGYMPSEVLRGAYEAALACLVQNKGTKAFSDNRELFPIAQVDLEWMQREWLRRMVAAGWRSWAVLSPSTALGAMTVRRWTAIYREHGIAVEAFETEDSALAWLREQPDTAALSGTR